MIDKGFLDELEKCCKVLEETKAPQVYYATAPYWVYEKVPKEEWVNYLETHPEVEVIFIKDFSKNIRYKLTEEGELKLL